MSNFLPLNADITGGDQPFPVQQGRTVDPSSSRGPGAPHLVANLEEGLDLEFEVEDELADETLPAAASDAQNPVLAALNAIQQGLNALFAAAGAAPLGGRQSPQEVNGSKNCTKGHHGWVGPEGTRSITVATSGTAVFRSVQAAVDAVPENNMKNVVIHISAGSYIEKVVVPASKPYITFQGAGKDKTIIEWHDRAKDRGPNGQQLRTYRTASVTVFANFFSARNISFKNTAPAPLPGMQGWQAVAFRISGDKAYFLGCGFYGAQDTLCDDAGRHYFKNCYIEGSIDFIFGNGRSMYKDCELHSVATRFGSIAAQDRNSPDEKTGFAFLNCRVTGSGPLYVGRAMGQYSRIVFSHTYFDDVVAHGGWDDWDHTSNKNETVFFGVYKCWGPGAAAVRGVSWARELDFETAHPFLAKSFVNGRHWIAPSDS